MRILQLHNKVPYPPKDGGAIGVWNFTIELARQGHQVTLFAMNTKKHYYDVQQIPENFTSLFKLISVKVDAPITNISAFLNLFFSRKPYNAKRFENKVVAVKLAELLKVEQFDVIQLEGLYVVPYIKIIRKYSKALISFKAHNIEYEIWQRVAKNETSFLKKKYLNNLSKRIKRMEIEALKLPDVVVNVTERDAKEFALLGNKIPSYVAPAGIDLSVLISNRSMIKFPSLFYLGALDWAPNQEGLIWFVKNVWKNISLKFPELKFEIAGRNAPEWLSENLKEEKNIIFLGEIDDAYTYINKGAIMIVPLLSGSGMRVKIIEGMALGKTIITSSIGTEGINTTHNFNILIADTADQFQKQIEKVLSDKQFFDFIGINAIKFVNQNFDIKQITKILLSFWNKHIQQ
jgi:glycosyltransferase involved in cell wall biosynthesis